MDDKQFKKMDERMMKAMKPLREKEVSEGMLKGFSASVERRLSTRQAGIASKNAPRLVWAPAAVAMVFALFVVLKSPVQSSFQLQPAGTPTMELAQLVSEQEIQDDVAVLMELGELNTEDSDALVSDEDVLAADMELSQKINMTSTMA